MLQRARSGPPPPSMAEMRAFLDRLFSEDPLPQGAHVDPVSVDGMPGEWVHGGNADFNHVVMYVHGGAYVRGSLQSHRGLAARLAMASSTRALVFEYRLAPEHPFPAAVEDSLRAYRWLLGQGIRPAHLVLAGDSAGGGLSVSTLLALRDAGEPLPCGAALMSPWTDLAATGESVTTRADADPWLSPERLGPGAAAYLAGANPRNPLASPLYGDLRGLPPLAIHVGNDEVIRDDSTRLAARARAAGVPATLEVWDGMWHVFQAFAGRVSEGRQSIKMLGAFIRERVTGTG